MGTILPISSYPSNLDTDTTLFKVFDTSETVLSATLNSWETTINVVPTEAGKFQIWADSGYVTIEGELIYYSSVTRLSGPTAGAVVSFNNCIRRTNGTPAVNYNAGTSVRGYVIAEHHNNLARALVNIETFIGTNDTTDKQSIYWKLSYINNLPAYTDDAGCPQIEFYYTVTSESPIQGTEISYVLNIIGTDQYSGFVIDFGDGSTETQATTGTHFYPPNKRIDPIATVNATSCETLQTSAQRVDLNDLQQNNLVGFSFPVIVPALPDFPIFDLNVVNPVQENIIFPPIVFPCLDIGPFGPIIVPSTISFVSDYGIPSVITFEDVPVIPSNIVITSSVVIPSVINIIDNIPTTITVIDDLPSIIDINSDLPSIISIIAPSNMSISLIAPSIINISPTVIRVNSNIPSVISISNADIAISLTSDYCTNCTGSIQSGAPNTAGGITDQGCNVCAGANQKIAKVSVVLHDFFVQTFGASTPYSRYDLVKVLVVDPNGNTCLIMGGNTAGNISTPQFIMNQPVTLTFEDGGANNIYDFSVPLKTGNYAPNANNNTTSTSAGGLVTLSSPAPAPSGFNGYGNNLSAFTDQPLVKGSWNVYIGVGPSDSSFTNLAYVSSACVRVNSNGEGPCDFPTPTPSPTGATPRPSKTPAPTPRRTNAPTATPKNTATPLPTPNPTPQVSVPFGPGGDPWPGEGGGGSGGGGGIVIPVDPGRPIPVTPKPSKTPKPTPAPTPLPNCGSCNFTPSIEDCGSGVCTYYWNFDTNSWDRCAECQSCTGAGENCGCPEARWMVSYGKLPANGSNNVTINTNCQKFVWTNNNLTQCSGGFCTYAYNPIQGGWSYFPNDSYCESGSGCSCPDPSILVAKGVLPRSSQNNITRHTKCYQETSLGNCNYGCECPDPPTVQTITSTSQIISKSCVPECGTCIDEYITDLNNPCDPDPTDQTCIYEYTGTFGWRLDPASFCGCDNMDCLSAQVAKNAGLLPDSPKDGETFNLSCYGGAWYNYDFCNPDANCQCPPTPTPPPAGQQPGESFLISQCINPTPTPSPTVGCGDCIFEFDAPVCGSGTCVYTYYSDLAQWTVGPNCGSSTCNCMNVEDAIFMGLLPENPGDGEQVNTSCYFYNSNQQALTGTWDFSSDTCTGNCGCANTDSYSGFGYFPGQLKLNDCIPTPDNTPAPTPLCGTCQYAWVGEGCNGTVNSCYYNKNPTEGFKFVSGFCGSGGCKCPTVEQLAKTISLLSPATLDFYTPCVNPDPNLGTYTPLGICTTAGCFCPYPPLGNFIINGVFVTDNCTQSCGVNSVCTDYYLGCLPGSNQNCGLPNLGGMICYLVPPATQIYGASEFLQITAYGSGYVTNTQYGNSPTYFVTLGWNGGQLNQVGPYDYNLIFSKPVNNIVLLFLASFSNEARLSCLSAAEVTVEGATPVLVESETITIQGNVIKLNGYINRDVFNCISTGYVRFTASTPFSTLKLSGSGEPWIGKEDDSLVVLGINVALCTQSLNYTFGSYMLEEDFSSYLESSPLQLNSQKQLLELTPTATPYVEHTPVPTPPPSITPSTSDVLTTQETLISKLSAIKKDKVKLCQFAGKEPLKMIKQGCGSCAIRKCDKFGLCSHTGIIEGHPEVICCQECSQYVPAGITSVKTMLNANAPVAQSINSESPKPNSQTLTSISANTPTTQSLSVAKDPITMADDLIQKNNKLKIVPTDSIIRVDLDDLLEGKSKNE